MKEHSSRKVNVLGIDVSVMRPEKAVNLTMDYMRRKGLEVVFFHSAESSLYCQNQSWAAESVQNMQLVLPGDSHMEMAIRHQRSSSEDRKGIGEFADEYLKRLFGKLNRESREIYAVMTKQEHLDSFKEYISSSYPDIFQNGTVFDGENTGTVLNEINANIPDIVFFCLPVEQQIMFVQDKEDLTKVLKRTRDGEGVYEEEYELQFAWDKQAEFLKAQSRAMGTLNNMIKQYDEMCHQGLADEEQRLRIAKLKAEVQDLQTGQQADAVAFVFRRKEDMHGD